ncbi:MAG: hypothetical protein H6713_36190 [Myxococcales bacterium]|nr:hypothetical protein [Myxococcales bacterium]
MGHRIENTTTMFRSVVYNIKTTPELRGAMERKLEELTGLIEAREGRVKRLREEYEIDAEQLAQLVIKFQNDDSGFVSYNQQGGGPREKLVPAGVIANIIREREMVDSERNQIRKLNLILRNIKDEEFFTHPRTGELGTRRCLHELTDSELEYLGF